MIYFLIYCIHSTYYKRFIPQKIFFKFTKSLSVASRMHALVVVTIHQAAIRIEFGGENYSESELISLI